MQGTLEHVGRKSGKRYRTPLNIFDTDDGYVIPVGYGLESHWVQNVLAGGPATIHKHGKTVPVANPRLVSKAEAAPLVNPAPALVPPPSLQRGGPGVDGRLGSLGRRMCGMRKSNFFAVPSRWV